MRSLPASQLADDGEADGTPVPPAYDPSSEEPLPHKDGVRKSVGSPLIGAQPNAQLLSSVGGASLKFSSLKSQLPGSPKKNT